MWQLGLVALCCVWNLLGAPAVGEGSVGLFVLLLSPFVVLVAVALWHGVHVPAHISWTRSGGEGALSTAILVAMWNYMGWDNASTVAREVENPRRNYPRAMIASTALVAVTYVIPLASMAYAGVPAGSFSTGSWADVARTMVGPWLGIAIVVGGTLTSVGMFNALTMSYARLPMVLAEDGLLPVVLARKNRRGVPWFAVLACAVAWALALRFSFERLISLDLILYGSSLILEFAALVVLRLREPNLERPFRAGSLVSACIIGAVPAALILYADFASRREHMAHMPALLLGALIAACGPLLYLVSKLASKRPRTVAAAAD
jgi:amino acid transporter